MDGQNSARVPQHRGLRPQVTVAIVGWARRLRPGRADPVTADEACASLSEPGRWRPPHPQPVLIGAKPVLGRPAARQAARPARGEAGAGRGVGNCDRTWIKRETEKGWKSCGSAETCGEADGRRRGKEEGRGQIFERLDRAKGLRTERDVGLADRRHGQRDPDPPHERARRGGRVQSQLHLSNHPDDNA